MRPLPLLIASTILAALSPLAAAQTFVGSPVIDHPIDDSVQGLTYIYLGGTQPLAGPGTAGTWSFFDNESWTLGQPVTPLLFERMNADLWRVVGIGTTRISTGGGLQNHPFGLLAGTATLLPGVSYTVGFTHHSYTMGPGGLAPVAPGSGVVDFIGYNDYSDRWAYANATATIGLELTAIPGSPLGAAALDSLGFGGRIYSAQFAFNRVANLPGCLPNPASLVCSAPNLAPGTPFQLTLTAPGFQGGLWQIYAGASGTGPLGCGLFLPGLGELLLDPVSQVPLVGGGLVAGVGQVNLAVPANPALIGQTVAMQGVAVSFDLPGFPLQLSSAVAAKILP